MEIKLSVIIVSYNNSKLLFNCLQRLYSVTQSKTSESEVIVIDNCSSDDSVKVVQQNFPQVVLIPNLVNLGFGKANNVAVSQARGKYILLINPDTVADCDLVYESLQFFSKYPDHKSAFGGILINSDGKEQRGSRRSFPTFANAFLYFTKLSKLIKLKKTYDLSGLPIETHEVECVSGACISMPKAMYEEIDGFDERFFLHFEDIDLCKRILQAGYKLWFYPEVRLLHIKGGSSQSSSESQIKVNQWFLDSLGKYLWKWNKLGAVIFSPALKMLQLAAWIKRLQVKAEKQL